MPKDKGDRAQQLVTAGHVIPYDCDGDHVIWKYATRYGTKAEFAAVCDFCKQTYLVCISVMCLFDSTV